jgi:hypothetical protein
MKISSFNGMMSHSLLFESRFDNEVSRLEMNDSFALLNKGIYKIHGR